MAVAALAGGLLFATQGRVEAVTCALLNGTLAINSPAESEILITHDNPLLGDAVVRVNGSPCGTLSTITAIQTNGSTGSERVTVDQSNGRFVFGSREILFTGNLGSGDPDFFIVKGQGVADNVTFGQAGTTLKGTLNADSNNEVTIDGVEHLVFDGQGGNDVFSGQGKPSQSLGPVTLPIDIRGGAGTDTLTGGNGDDTLNGGPGNDAMNGAAGTDTVSFAGETMPVLVNLGTGTATGEQSGDDTFVGTERSVGGSSNDTFIDNPLVCDHVQGGPGDDTFVAVTRPGGENCVTQDSDGGDFFDGGDGLDTYDATIMPANSPGAVFDFANQIVHGSGTDDCVNCENAKGTEAGDDTFIDDPAHCNVFNGNGGDDTFIAVNRPGGEDCGSGDTFDGGAGIDTYDATDMPANSPGAVFDFANQIVHGSGEDACINCENGEGTEAGDDTFIDDPAHCNVFNGNGGDDTFKAMTRPGGEDCGSGDTFDGGEGGETNGDTYDATDMPANSPGAVFDFANQIVHGSGEDACINCENAEGTVGDDVFIDEDSSCNTFNGHGGDDLFYAGVQRPGSEPDPEHGDRVDSQPGDGKCGDIVDLGDGGEVNGDTLDYERTEANSPGVKIDLPAGIVSGSPEDIGRRAENAFGSEHDDVIIGTTGFNVLKGRGGDDTIITNGGGDDVDGGEGNDTVDGVPEEPPAGFTCNLQTGTLTYNGETTNVTSCPDGTEGDDVFIGNDADNTFNGNGGNDRLEGGGGNDTLNGGSGDDTILGGNGDDTINGGDGNDHLDGGNGDDTIEGGAGDDEIHGGNNGRDDLSGGEGNDTIDGGNGDDRLAGGPGNDTLIGGTGNDFIDGSEGSGTGADNIDGGLGQDQCVNHEGDTVVNCET